MVTGAGALAVAVLGENAPASAFVIWCGVSACPPSFHLKVTPDVLRKRRVVISM
jgi:hypothetical protein